jgi:hypothetical protein
VCRVVASVEDGDGRTLLVPVLSGATKRQANDKLGDCEEQEWPDEVKGFEVICE